MPYTQATKHWLLPIAVFPVWFMWPAPHLPFCKSFCNPALLAFRILTQLSRPCTKTVLASTGAATASQQSLVFAWLLTLIRGYQVIMSFGHYLPPSDLNSWSRNQMLCHLIFSAEQLYILVSQCNRIWNLSSISLSVFSSLQLLHLYSLWESQSVRWDEISLRTLFIPQTQQHEAHPNNTWSGPRVLVGSAARILLCELYYRYTTGNPLGVVTIFCSIKGSIDSPQFQCPQLVKEANKWGEGG